MPVAYTAETADAYAAELEKTIDLESNPESYLQASLPPRPRCQLWCANRAPRAPPTPATSAAPQPVKIPRVPWGHPMIQEKCIPLGLPVVITSSELVADAVERWNPEYLRGVFGDQKLTTFKSNSRYFR